MSQTQPGLARVCLVEKEFNYRMFLWLRGCLTISFILSEQLCQNCIRFDSLIWSSLLPHCGFCQLTCFHFAVCILVEDQHRCHSRRGWHQHPGKPSGKRSVCTFRLCYQPCMAFMNPKYFGEKGNVTCIIADEVGVVFLNAIV